MNICIYKYLNTQIYFLNVKVINFNQQINVKIYLGPNMLTNEYIWWMNKFVDIYSNIFEYPNIRYTLVCKVVQDLINNYAVWKASWCAKYS